MIEIGNKLNDRYQIIGSIGSGGMANVFLAHDLILDRDVAIKVLRFDFQNDQSSIRRFQREALAATELVHPNIVSVYDVGEEKGLQYLVMEYVKGMDLKKYIQTYYPMPYRTVVNIVEQILSAVSLAHEHRIIHRDLKPQNILIDEDDNVKITDFGIAIALSETSITQTNTMLGSVHYLSPEQARGSMATEQSDIYAVGVVLYEMLTGSVPFDGESAVTIALKHFQETIPSVKDFDPKIPQSLENVVLHATAKDPVDRYKSADEMSRDLYTVLAANRLNEPKWQPSGLAGETKILKPITDDTPMPSSFKDMPLPTENEEVKEPETVENTEDDQTTKKSKRRKIIFAVVTFMLLAFIGVGIFLFFMGSKKEEVKIPDVANQTKEQARQVLEDAGLKVNDKTIELSDKTIEEGKIIKTDPLAGTTVKSGREITLYVSSGIKVKLSDYKKRDIEEVKKELKDKGFADERIIVEEESSSEISEDKVIRQTPSAGKEVDPKTDQVKLVVSTGPEKIIMENYAGYSYENAVSVLVSVGIKETQISRVDEANDYYDKGVVFGQTPEAGTAFDPKTSKITLKVSSGTDKVTLGNYATGTYTYAGAISALADLGIKESQVDKNEAYSDQVPSGNVMTQNPAGGTVFDPKKDRITLTVSKGADPNKTSMVDLPNVIGLTEAAARDKLKNFTKIITREENSTAAEGTVIKVMPSTNQVSNFDIPIELIISTGRQ